MMKQYGTRKKESGSKIIMLTLIISWIIIGLGVWYVFFKSPKISTPTSNKDMETNTGNNINSKEEDTTRYHGEKILSTGKIQSTETFTTFTHHFTTDKGEKFGLKSKNIDMYTFKDGDTVEIKGEISDFKGDLPIITVSEIIKHKEKKSGNSGIVHGNSDYYLFKDDAIGFDLSVSDGYRVEKKGEKIILIDTETEKQTEVITISPFSCKSGSPLEDCDILERKLNENKADSFISSQGIKFYHLSESTTRLAFHKNSNHGYYLSPKDENKFVSFANLMSFMDEDIVKKAVNKKISSMCKNIHHTLKTVDTFSYNWNKGGLVEVSLVGTTKNQIVVHCTLGVKLGNSLQVENISFNAEDDKKEEKIIEKENEVESEKKDNKEKEEKIEKEIQKKEIAVEVENKEVEQENNDEVEEEQENEVEIQKKDAITPPSTKEVADNEDYGTGSRWFTYNSVRGYKVHFANKNISYAGKILDTATNLGIEGLRCPYKINVVTWKQAENVGTNPSLEIYECKGTINAATLAENNIQQVGSIDDVVFLTKRYDNPWGNMNIVVKE